MEPIWLGAVAYDPKAVTIWEEIREVFRSARVPFEYALLSSYESLVEALFAGRIDIAWATPTAYLQVSRRCEGREQTLGMRDVDVGMRCLFVARRGSSLHDLSALRGKTVAFGSRDSPQAAILPRHWLEEKAGLAADRDYRPLRFDIDVGKHGDTGTSELNGPHAGARGVADAGALCDATWGRVAAEGLPDAAGCQLLWSSPPFNHCMFVGLPQLAPEKAKAFRDALFSMDFNRPEHRRAMELEGLRRWLPPNLEGYGDLRTAMERQGVFGS